MLHGSNLNLFRIAIASILLLLSLTSDSISQATVEVNKGTAYPNDPMLQNISDLLTEIDDNWKVSHSIQIVVINGKVAKAIVDRNIKCDKLYTVDNTGYVSLNSLNNVTEVFLPYAVSRNPKKDLTLRLKAGKAQNGQYDSFENVKETFYYTKNERDSVSEFFIPEYLTQSIAEKLAVRIREGIPDRNFGRFMYVPDELQTIWVDAKKERTWVTLPQELGDYEKSIYKIQYSEIGNPRDWGEYYERPDTTFKNLGVYFNESKVAEQVKLPILLQDSLLGKQFILSIVNKDTGFTRNSNYFYKPSGFDKDQVEFNLVYHNNDNKIGSIDCGNMNNFQFGFNEMLKTRESKGLSGFSMLINTNVKIDPSPIKHPVIYCGDEVDITKVKLTKSYDFEKIRGRQKLKINTNIIEEGYFNETFTYPKRIVWEDQGIQYTVLSNQIESLNIQRMNEKLIGMPKDTWAQLGYATGLIVMVTLMLM